MPDSRLLPEFTSKIDLGHILQSVVIVLTVGGGAIGGYIALSDRISAQSARMASIEAQALQQSRVVQDMQAEQRRFADRTSDILTKLSDQLTDLRILVAGARGQDGQPRR